MAAALKSHVLPVVGTWDMYSKGRDFQLQQMKDTVSTAFQLNLHQQISNLVKSMRDNVFRKSFGIPFKCIYSAMPHCSCGLFFIFFAFALFIPVHAIPVFMFHIL
eukprot:TRINITY_DN433_c0_g1_i1.p2 TRINITY_DN433_c0_g1~~TRINITY_DN433_c0_g1_i1.p2  ORF type:complete len:105 (-),score=9.62 TRINITY_DN433_c0_g1_i1:18-332(-)